VTCGCRKIRRTRLLPPLARGVLAFCHLSVAGARNPGSRRVRPWACVRQLPLIPLRAYVQRKRRARMFSTGFAVSSCRLPVRAWTCRPVTCPKPQVARSPGAGEILLPPVVAHRNSWLHGARILWDTRTHAGPERPARSRQGSGQTERMPNNLVSLAQDMLVSLAY